MQLTATKHGDNLKSTKAEIAEYTRRIAHIHSDMELIKGQVRTLFRVNCQKKSIILQNVNKQLTACFLVTFNKNKASILLVNLGKVYNM